MRVLIVDDNHNFARFLHICLNSRGDEAHTVTTLGEAVARVQKERFDLYLIDILMPDGDGRELAAHLVDELHVSPEAIVFMSAMEAADVEATERLSRHPVLHKPFRLNGLLRILRETTVRAR